MRGRISGPVREPGPIISLRDVTKTFKLENGDLNVLKGINLDVREGEFLTIMGPSGSGKTTLLNIMGAMDTPTSGTLDIDGVRVSSTPESRMHDIRRTKVSHIFQQFHLVMTLTALENLLVPLVPTGISKSEAIKRGIHKLELVGMQDRSGHKPGQLSGGQQQRIAIARALMSGSRILLADEPTGNLDTRTGKDIMDLLLSLNKAGLTIVMVTHNPELASLTDRTIHVRDGLVWKDLRSQ